MKYNKSICVDAMESLLTEGIERNVSMACYRLPKDEKIQVAVQTTGRAINIQSYDKLNHAQGFLAIPFEQHTQFRAYLIQPDITFSYPLSGENKADHNEIKKNAAVKNAYSSNYSFPETSREEFLEQIKVIQSNLREGHLQKLVLSRIAIEARNYTKSVEDIFFDLALLYPDAFVYFFNIPDVGCWMGATPEPFLVLDQDSGIVESVAGTMLLNGQQPEKVEWGRKEQEEQDIVTRFIEQRLQIIGISNFQKEGPVTTQAGQLAHLRTRFIFSKKQVEKRIGEFIHTFHPTPSVGGYPQEEAYRLIAALEKHKREFYTGIVGPLQIKGKTALFANIRCMKIMQEAFWLYMGAGITQASVPEMEWEETNLKKTTILAALKHNEI